MTLVEEDHYFDMLQFNNFHEREDEDEPLYMRHDHKEGIWVNVSFQTTKRLKRNTIISPTRKRKRTNLKKQEPRKEYESLHVYNYLYVFPYVIYINFLL